MPSPCPGMDPYLEAHWRDIHARLVIYASDALKGVLPRSLRARIEESVLLETPQGIGDQQGTWPVSAELPGAVWPRCIPCRCGNVYEP